MASGGGTGGGFWGSSNSFGNGFKNQNVNMLGMSDGGGQQPQIQSTFGKDAVGVQQQSSAALFGSTNRFAQTSTNGFGGQSVQGWNLFSNSFGSHANAFGANFPTLSSNGFGRANTPGHASGANGFGDLGSSGQHSNESNAFAAVRKSYDQANAFVTSNNAFGGMNSATDSRPVGVGSDVDFWPSGVKPFSSFGSQTRPDSALAEANASTRRSNSPPKAQWRMQKQPQICRFFNSPQGCKHGDACKFKHEIEGTVDESLPSLNPAPDFSGGGSIKDVPCKYFAQGRCSKGDACAFSHTSAVAAMSSAAAFSNIPLVEQISPPFSNGTHESQMAREGLQTVNLTMRGAGDHATPVKAEDRRRPERIQKGFQVRISRIPPSTTNDALRQHLSRFCTVKSLRRLSKRRVAEVVVETRREARALKTGGQSFSGAKLAISGARALFDSSSEPAPASSNQDGRLVSIQNVNSPERIENHDDPDDQSDYGDEQDDSAEDENHTGQDQADEFYFQREVHAEAAEEPYRPIFEDDNFKSGPDDEIEPSDLNAGLDRENGVLIQRLHVLQDRLNERRKQRDRAEALDPSVMDQPFVGTLMTMCSEVESLKRQIANDISFFEGSLFSGNSRIADVSLTLKKYQRSGAGKDRPLPEEVRPPRVLREADMYICISILDHKVSFFQIYSFCRDRMRSIRQDFDLQSLSIEDAMPVFQHHARFHILAFYELCKTNPEELKQNSELLNKCLVSINQMYEDDRRADAPGPSEGEFQAYRILLDLDNTGLVAVMSRRLPVAVMKSPDVKFAISASRAFLQNNYVAFFRLVRNPCATFLQRCLLHRYFGRVWNAAIEIIYCAMATNKSFPLLSLVDLLGFDDEGDAAAFCTNCGLQVSDDSLIKDPSRFVEVSARTFQESNLVTRRAAFRWSDIVLGNDAHCVEKTTVPLSTFGEVNNRGQGSANVDPVSAVSPITIEKILFPAPLLDARRESSDASAPAKAASNPTVKNDAEEMNLRHEAAYALAKTFQRRVCNRRIVYFLRLWVVAAIRSRNRRIEVEQRVRNERLKVERQQLRMAELGWNCYLFLLKVWCRRWYIRWHRCRELRLRNDRIATLFFLKSWFDSWINIYIDMKNLREADCRHMEGLKKQLAGYQPIPFGSIVKTFQQASERLSKRRRLIPFPESRTMQQSIPDIDLYRRVDAIYFHVALCTPGPIDAAQCFPASWLLSRLLSVRADQVPSLLAHGPLYCRDDSIESSCDVRVLHATNGDIQGWVDDRGIDPVKGLTGICLLLSVVSHLDVYGRLHVPSLDEALIEKDIGSIRRVLNVVDHSQQLPLLVIVEISGSCTCTDESHFVLQEFAGRLQALLGNRIKTVLAVPLLAGDIEVSDVALSEGLLWLSRNSIQIPRLLRVIPSSVLLDVCRLVTSDIPSLSQQVPIWVEIFNNAVDLVANLLTPESLSSISWPPSLSDNRLVEFLPSDWNEADRLEAIRDAILNARLPKLNSDARCFDRIMFTHYITPLLPTFTPTSRSRVMRAAEGHDGSRTIQAMMILLFRTRCLDAEQALFTNGLDEVYCLQSHQEIVERANAEISAYRARLPHTGNQVSPPSTFVDLNKNEDKSGVIVPLGSLESDRIYYLDEILAGIEDLSKRIKEYRTDHRFL